MLPLETPRILLYVETLRPEGERVKPVFGISVEDGIYQIIKTECELNAYFALKEMWLNLLKQEKELLSK